MVGVGTDRTGEATLADALHAAPEWAIWSVQSKLYVEVNAVFTFSTLPRGNACNLVAAAASRHESVDEMALRHSSPSLSPHSLCPFPLSDCEENCSRAAAGVPLLKTKD